VWANAHLPNQAVKEQQSFKQYFDDCGGCLLCDYLKVELKHDERIVCENDAFAALVPFWAVWPFETIVISRRHRTGLDDLTDAERDSLSDLLKRLTTRYDNLFETPFPYSMGF